MKKWYVIILIVMSVFLLVSCKKAKEQETVAIATPIPTNPIDSITPTIIPDPMEGDREDQDNTTQEDVKELPGEDTTEVASDISYDILEVSYLKDDAIKIYYPQVAHMENKEVQDKINELIRLAAIRYTDGFDTTRKNHVLENDYIITWKGKRLISIQFIGYIHVDTAAYPSSFSYTVNIDLNTGNKVRLSDLLSIGNGLIELILNKGSSKYLYFTQGRELQEDLSFLEPDIINTIKDYILSGDYLTQNTAVDTNDGGIYSYFTEDSLGISFDTVHAIGDHIQFELKYDELADYINYDNTLWEDFQKVLSNPESEGTNNHGSETTEQKGFVLDENLIWKNINYVPEFYIIKDQSFQVSFENWGEVTFVAGFGEGDFSLDSLYLYLADKNSNILYEFPYFYGNGMMFSRIAAVSFEDVNEDGLKDVIVIAYYMTGAGPTGAEEFEVADVYFQKGKEFITLPEVADEINSIRQNDSIAKIVDYVKNMSLALDGSE